MVFKIGDKVKLSVKGCAQGFVYVDHGVTYTVSNVKGELLWVEGVISPYDMDYWELVKTEMKYKVGDKVRIVDNKCSHGFILGDIVVVDRVNNNDENYLAHLFQDPDESWFVTEDDVGFFMDLKLQTPMEIVDSSYESKATPEIVDNTLTIVDDPVESPSHYSSDKIECVDYLKDNMPFEAYLGGLEWNVKKYLHRWRRKGKPVEDLLKAKWYLTRLINELES